MRNSSAVQEIRSSATSAAGALTATEIAEFAKEWYRKLDVHAPMVEILPFLASEGLVMKFPEATARGLADFESWYQRVIRIFFDEVHTVKEVTPSIRGNQAEVHVVVEWQASVWNPPQRNSARIVLDADQTWTVQRSSRTGGVEITNYTVNGLNYHEGSAKL
jgi:hypothetical protein